MGVLVISLNEQRRIDAALAEARRKPMPLSVMREIGVLNDSTMLKLADIKRPALVEAIREEYPAHQIRLGTYRAAISFEEHPGGLMRHLSVSTHRKGKVPTPTVVGIVAEAFGFSGWPPKRTYRVWFEEFEPGWAAVNVAEVER